MEPKKEAEAQATPKAEAIKDKLYPETKADAAPAESKEPVKAEEAKVEGTEEKTPEAKAEEKAQPEKFELKLPEDSVLDETHVLAVTSLAQEKGLTQDQAQEMLNRDSTLLKGFKEGQQKLFAEQVKVWAEQVQSDSEIGGASYKDNVHLASQVVTKYGSEQFKKDLDATGFGNHPELMRFLTRIGKAIGNDSLVKPGAQAQGKRKSMEEIFYGASNN